MVEAGKVLRLGQGRHGRKAEQQGKVKVSMLSRLKARREARLGQGWQGGEEQSRQGSAVEAGRVVLRMVGREECHTYYHERY